jgi:outer membrane protein OmpA-like peptidoglycan-associated protein
LFACTDAECDSGGNTNRFVSSGARPRPFDIATPSTGHAFGLHRELCYLAAKLSAPGKEVYASLLVAIEGLNLHKDTFNHPLVHLEVVETNAMDANMVFVDAATMAKDIVSTGRAVLYGIYFDTAKDIVKPESEPTLAEVGKLLTADRAVKLYVVGHTDNVGGFDSNMDLSTRRANAVVAHLRARYGVDATRLRPVGVGFVAPVAPNASDDGRAKNRRVELVKQ